MHSEKEIQTFLEALFNFKSALYLSHFQQVIKKLESIKPKDKQENALFRAIVDTASRFTIDLYDLIDQSTRDSISESEIPQFWKNAKKIIEKKMDVWLQESMKNTPYLLSQNSKLRTDIREFQERATKFHMERQSYAFTLKKAKNDNPINL